MGRKSKMTKKKLQIKLSLNVVDCLMLLTLITTLGFIILMFTDGLTVFLYQLNNGNPVPFETKVMLVGAWCYIAGAINWILIVIQTNHLQNLIQIKKKRSQWNSKQEQE